MSKRIISVNFLIIIFIFLFSNNNLKGQIQSPPCAPNYSYFSYQAPFLSQYPPFSLSMPYDVILAYIVLDSISYNQDSVYGVMFEAKNFIRRQTYNDTLQKIMRYYYQMVDWDPIRFEQSKYYVNPVTGAPLSFLENEIYTAIRKNSPTSSIDYPLCRSHYILHIKPTSINRITDTIPGDPYPEVDEVHCQILDTIKGKRIPLIFEPVQISNKMNNKNVKNNNLNSDPLPTDSVFDFQYCPYWSSYLWDDYGIPLIKADSEYIIFVSSVLTCLDSATGIYFRERSVWEGYQNFLIFPVRNGIVDDQFDVFGFGNGKTTAVFKSKLRQRINQIITY